MTRATGYKNNQILESQDNVCYGLSDVYDHYKNTAGSTPIAYKRFRQILTALNTAIFSYILEGYSFKFPYNLGILKIKKRKLTLLNKKMLRVDFAATKKYGKTIYHPNEHTNGFYYKFAWSRGCVKNIMKYSFSPTRKYKRTLAQEIKVEKRDYSS